MSVSIASMKSSSEDCIHGVLGGSPSGSSGAEKRSGSSGATFDDSSGVGWDDVVANEKMLFLVGSSGTDKRSGWDDSASSGLALVISCGSASWSENWIYFEIEEAPDPEEGLGEVKVLFDAKLCFMSLTIRI